MTRSFNKRQFKLKEHLERLYASMKYVRLSIEMSMAEMERRIEETIAATITSLRRMMSIGS